MPVGVPCPILNNPTTEAPPKSPRLWISRAPGGRQRHLAACLPTLEGLGRGATLTLWRLARKEKGRKMSSACRPPSATKIQQQKLDKKSGGPPQHRETAAVEPQLLRSAHRSELRPAPGYRHGSLDHYGSLVGWIDRTWPKAKRPLSSHFLFGDFGFGGDCVLGRCSVDGIRCSGRNGLEGRLHGRQPRSRQRGRQLGPF